MSRQIVLVTEKKKEPEDKIVGLRRLECSNGRVHKVCIARYGDGSIWVFCPYFGNLGIGFGCKIRQARCRYFKAT